MEAKYRRGLETRRRAIWIQSYLVVALFCTYLLLSPALANSAQMSTSETNVVEQAFVQMPTYFVENRGQMDPCIRYYHKGRNYGAFFTDTGIVFSVGSHGLPAQVILTPQGMSGDSEVLGSKLQAAVVNVFRGNNPSKWQTNIPTYGSVIYREAWRGVDLAFYGNDQQLEYDILVNAGGDLSKVTMRYDGIRDAALTENGDLTIGLSTGALLVQKRLVAYQEIGGKRIERKAEFKIIQTPSARKPEDPLIYGFDVAYDPGHALVIDPVLVFSTFLGGNWTDYGIEVAADASGNTLVAGITQSLDFPNTPQRDIFIAKIDKTGGNLIYFTQLGGSDIELDCDYPTDDNMELYNFGLDVDQIGNAYVACNTRSADFPTTAGAYNRTIRGVADAVVVKLDLSGNLAYSTYLGGSGWDEAGGIAVDKDGDVYILGGTKSPDFPTTIGAYRRNPYGQDDLFVTKLSLKDNMLIYSTYLGGSGWDESSDIAVDLAGDAYILGGGDSTDYPTTEGAFNRTNNDQGAKYDVYLTRLNSEGSRLVYSTFLGGSGKEWAEGLAIDAWGNAYVSGGTTSSNFPVTPYAFDTTFHTGPGKNGFVCKFSNDGRRLLYSTLLGSGDGALGSTVMGISADSSYNAIVTGITSSSEFPTTIDAFERALQGSSDAFIAKISSKGDRLLYSTLLGGTGTEGFEAAFGNAIDSYGYVHVTGLTNSADFPVESAVQPHYAGGGNDAFVLKISGLADPRAGTIIPQVYFLLEESH